MGSEARDENFVVRLSGLTFIEAVLLNGALILSEFFRLGIFAAENAMPWRDIDSN
jgi:hypothetical protein